MKIFITQRPDASPQFSSAAWKILKAITNREAIPKQRLIELTNKVLQEDYGKADVHPTPTLRHCFELLDKLGFEYEVEYDRKCYVWTCHSTENLQPPIRDHKPWENPVQYCKTCDGLMDDFERDCNELGMEAHDENFIIYRAGALSARSDVKEILELGKNYHGSEKHSDDWHEGFQTACRLWLGEE